MIRIFRKNNFFDSSLKFQLYCLRHFKHPSIVRFYNSYNVDDDIWVGNKNIAF